jgi:hypothetical protein
MTTERAATIVRQMRRLADIYALTADMLEDETGDLAWQCGPFRIFREERGLTIWRVDRDTSEAVHFAEPGAAGDYLVAVGAFVQGKAWQADAGHE